MSPVPSPRAGQAAVAPLVLVVIGTDAHPFDRLMRWLEGWHESQPALARFLIQHGHTAAPAMETTTAFLAHSDLQEAMAGAELVVSHGGPGTITEARRHGRLPIVVPRDPERGEHVDNHQQLFARRLAREGLIRLCEDQDMFASTLIDGLMHPERYMVDAGSDAGRLQAVARVGDIVGSLVATRRHGRK